MENVLEGLEQVHINISRYEDRCAEVEKELKKTLTVERRETLESQLNLLLENLVELRKEKNRLKEAQDRSAAAAPGSGSMAAGGRVTSAAGLGMQSAAGAARLQGGAGASCQPGPGGARAYAAASQLLAEFSCSNVVRLVDGGATVGSCCVVSFNGRKFILAARHCMDPKPRQRINVTSFTVCGHRLRHLASFPKHDVTVLLLDDGEELPDVLRNANPFEVDGGMGLMPGMTVTLISFPLAADKTIMGFQQSGIPLIAPGHVCWLSKQANEAMGSYAGTFPNCSGGAVAFGPPFRYLAGMHSGIMWHEHGTNPRDIATGVDQDDTSGSRAPAAATAAGGELVVETDTWSADDDTTGLTGQAPACGGEKKRKPVSRQEGLACDVQYCLDNVGHKSCMGTFVPAHVLVRLLSCCHELLADEDRGR